MRKTISALHWTDRVVHRPMHCTAGLFLVIAEWVRRSETRRELAGLSDRELRDFGLTRFDATREARKPFWRA
jgi:uncharacterized protein YjiS (DUF1127 family)